MRAVVVLAAFVALGCGPEEPAGFDGAGGSPPERVCGAPGTKLRPSVDGLDLVRGCTVVEGDLSATFALGALTALREVHGDLSFGCRGERDLDGLQRLERVGGELKIKICDDLVTLRHLESLTSVGSLFLEGMFALEDLRGLEGLTEIEGDVELNTLLVATSLEGLHNLRRVGGRLRILGIHELTSLRGLAALEVVEGDLVIAHNDRLPRAEIDAFLARVRVGGRIEVEP